VGNAHAAWKTENRKTNRAISAEVVAQVRSGMTVFLHDADAAD